MANINLTPKSLDAVNQLIDDDNVEAYIRLCDDLIDKIMETGTDITLSDAEYRDYTASLHNLCTLCRSTAAEDEYNKQ